MQVDRGWSRVESVAQLYTVWALIGVVMSAVLYEPAIAVITVWFERRWTRALTAMTLIAGFASISGAMAAFVTAATAIAPIGAGAAYDVLGRYDPLFWGFVGVSAVAASVVLNVRADSPGSEAAPAAAPSVVTG